MRRGDFHFIVVCPKCSCNHPFEGTPGIDAAAKSMCQCGAVVHAKAETDGGCVVTIEFPLIQSKPILRVVSETAVVK